MSKAGKAWRSVELADEERLTAGVVHHRSPCWSPDGKWLAYAADDCWLIVDRRGRMARVFEGPAHTGAGFGPDGAFAFGRGKEIWLSPGGSAPAVRLLGGDGGLYRDPVFSHDGSRLVVAHSADGGTRTSLLSLEISTGARQILTDDPRRSDTHPAFSPDGDILFFEGIVGNDSAIWALDKNELTRVSRIGASYRRPAPLSSELLIAERTEAGGTARLILLDWTRNRERPLHEVEGEQHDPAVCRTPKGKTRLAWSSLPKGEGKPTRADVAIARVKGLEAFEEQPVEEVQVA
jgi:Tol biopolymer transport system component